VPDGWAWCRIKEVCTVFGRIGFRGYTRDDLVEKGNGAITLSPSNLINMKLDLTDCTYISWPKYEESPEIQLDINDIVVVKTGSSYGKTSLVDNLTEKTTLNPQLMVLKERKCNSKYLCYFLNTQYMRKHFEDLVNGTAIPTFSQEKFGMKQFPLPPASEQEKIVSKIELIFDKIDLLENDKEDLDTIIKQAKSKILDLAIHGKLVPQDPNDEPAEELLKRIATSDNRPYEKVEEEPFEIPASWKWGKLGYIVDILDSKRKPITKSDRKSGIYPYYGATCIQDYVSDYLFDEDLLLLGEDGAKWGKGEISAFCISGKTWVNNHAHVLRPLHKISMQYLCYTLNILDLTPFVTGTTVPKLNQLNMAQILIPLPPIKEQEIIVQKIEQLFVQLEQIQCNLI